MSFNVLWEDRYLVIVNKHAGLLTVPTKSCVDNCLVKKLKDYYSLCGVNNSNLFIVHRLDRYTSGLLIFAKTVDALHGLKKKLKRHDVCRTYIAILVGELLESSGTLIHTIIEDGANNIKIINNSYNFTCLKRIAITHYCVLERLFGYTIVRIMLETGRRNQIRVQFAEYGFPIFGDKIYGVNSVLIGRQALHAESLGFQHPITNEKINIIAPIPNDIINAVRLLCN